MADPTPLPNTPSAAEIPPVPPPAPALSGDPPAADKDADVPLVTPEEVLNILYQLADLQVEDRRRLVALESAENRGGAVKAWEGLVEKTLDKFSWARVVFVLLCILAMTGHADTVLNFLRPYLRQILYAAPVVFPLPSALLSGVF